MNSRICARDQQPWLNRSTALVEQINEMIDHEDNCGHCSRMKVDADVAKEILASYPKDADIPMEEATGKWCDLATKKWQEGKYFKLWQEEKAAGRDPHQAFKDRGWEP